MTVGRSAGLVALCLALHPPSSAMSPISSIWMIFLIPLSFNFQLSTLNFQLVLLSDTELSEDVIQHFLRGDLSGDFAQCG